MGRIQCIDHFNNATVVLVLIFTTLRYLDVIPASLFNRSFIWVLVCLTGAFTINVGKFVTDFNRVSTLATRLLILSARLDL